MGWNFMILRISIRTPYLKISEIRILKRRLRMLLAIFTAFAIGNQICRHPIRVPASGWNLIFFTFSPTYKPAPRTLLVHSQKLFPMYTHDQHSAIIFFRVLMLYLSIHRDIFIFYCLYPSCM